MSVEEVLGKYRAEEDPRLEAGIPLAVVGHYGFANCKTLGDVKILRDVYKSFFTIRGANPLELHQACMRGEIYEYLAAKLPLFDTSPKRLFKNSYTKKAASKYQGLSHFITFW